MVHLNGLLDQYIFCQGPDKAKEAGRGHLQTSDEMIHKHTRNEPLFQKYAVEKMEFYKRALYLHAVDSTHCLTPLQQKQ